MFKTITSSQRSLPPAWAVLERQLISAIDEAAPIFLEKYTRPGGTLIWREDYPGDGVWADDLYEAFFNWPLYYALGGSSYSGAMAVQEWNAITRQIAHDYGRATKDRYFQVRLLPGTEINLHITMVRFCNKPSYALPWHGATIPFR